LIVLEPTTVLPSPDTPSASLYGKAGGGGTPRNPSAAVPPDEVHTNASVPPPSWAVQTTTDPATFVARPREDPAPGAGGRYSTPPSSVQRTAPAWGAPYAPTATTPFLDTASNQSAPLFAPVPI